MLDPIHYAHDTEKTPHLVVFGAVHGNETCGPVAINHWINRFKTGEVALARGSVTFVPVCNPRAYEQNKRFAEVNLNRVYVKKDAPTLYEEKLAQELMPLIDGCDFLLDIHSATSPTRPFVFQDSNAQSHQDFADILGVPHILVGWNDYFPPNNNFRSGLSHAIHQGKTGAVVECGQHNEPGAVDIAKQAIGNALAHLGMIKGKPHIPHSPKRYELFSHGVRHDAETLAKTWHGFDIIKAGDIIVQSESNQNTVAQKNGYIVLPAPHSSVGEEWFYLVEEKI